MKETLKNSVPLEDKENSFGRQNRLLKGLNPKIYRYHIRYEASSLWSYILESSILRSIGWIPGLLGGLIRNLLYRTVFKSLGSLAFIESNVEIKSPQSILLGKRSVLQSHVQLNAWSLAGEIELEDFAWLDRGVNITVHGKGKIKIGYRTYVGPYTCIAGPGKVEIGSNCLISSHCGIYANNHLFEDSSKCIRSQGFSCKGITIEDDCWLGSGVKILDGVTVGEGCVIGAGAVVTKSIPAYSIAVGVPARIVSSRKELKSRFEPDEVLTNS